MSSSGIAVSVRGLSKAYTIAHADAAPTTAAEALMRRIRQPLRRPSRETFWALRDVSFELEQGDAVGIIGRNGAGKSTLLKVLSRITEPAAGEIDIYGRVGSLLEVGTGFHPELTGRENIFLNGAILGMKRREIARQFDAIVEFAGVEPFLDTPVKRYSSGMYVRLAFAVAAHLSSEVLIVDEVLAVGDAEFQKKCLGKMGEVAQQEGRTVLFVSHNMQAVSRLCNKGILLQDGAVAHAGDARGAVEEYLSRFRAAAPHDREPDRRPGTGEYRFASVTPAKSLFDGDEEKEIRFRIEHRHSRMGRMYLSAHIVDSRDVVVAQYDSRLLGFWIEDAPWIEGSLTFRTPWLKPGAYRVDMGICSHSGQPDLYEGACTLEISPILPYPCSADGSATSYGLVFGEFQWTCRAGASAPFARPGQRV